MMASEKKIKELDGFRVYPSFRDHPLKTAAMWLKGRRTDDDIGDFWRVHDKLYDLTDFMGRHPGGRQWLEVTRGTDITEAFESSHINPSTKNILDRYYVKEANSSRVSPFTFHPDGFYSILKSRVHDKLSELSAEEKSTGRRRVIKVQNILLFSFGSLFLLSALLGSYWLAALAGFALFLNINCAHNFYHQRNSWRMYAWDLGLLSSHEWRVTHGLSHHGFTNSLLDFELSDFEPIFDFRVYQKSFLQRYLPAILILTIGEVFFFQEAVKRVITVVSGQQKLRPENLLPLAQLGLLFLLSDSPCTIWLIIHATSSYFFAVIGIIAAHHHPDMYHSGDGTVGTSSDWGLAQLDAVRDRKDVNGTIII